MAEQKGEDRTWLRLVAWDWTLTTKAVDGTYPNWRQVVPHFEQHRTTVTLPEEQEFSKIVNDLPGGDLKDKPVVLEIENHLVAVSNSHYEFLMPEAFPHE